MLRLPVVAWRSLGRFAAQCAIGAVLLSPVGALAFDFEKLDVFNLFTEKPTPVSQQALPYTLTIETGEAPSAVKEAVEQSSILYRTRADAPTDGEILVRRAQADFTPVVEALWGAGYYNASITIEIAGQPLRPDQTAAPRVVAAAEALRSRDRVPVKIVVTAGPLFKLRNIAFINARTRQPFTLEELPMRTTKLRPGEPARASDLRAAESALVDYFRSESYPLAKVVTDRPVVYHPEQVVDVTIAVNTGPRAPFGMVTVAGKSDVDPKVVRSFIYIEPGDPYSPQAIAKSRKSVLKLPAISSIRFREAERLDANGQLPVTAEVTDRKPRLIGFGARYSTLDGPALQTYWQHRNLFGGAESLRLEADVFVPPRIDGSALDNLKTFELNDLGGRFKASFIKPALGGSRNDLLIDGMVEKDNTGGDQYGGYSAKRSLGTVAIRHRFTDAFSVQFGVAGEVGRTNDTLGEVDYRLFGLPASITYDSTDKPLDPTKGFRALASVTPYAKFLGSSVGIVESKAQASTYYALDEDARYILAARVGVGSVSGGDLRDIPTTHRFYAGGGGSVRGYRYRSLSPLGPTGQVTGGRSLLEASLEARIKITDTIGLVPFVDMGGAFESPYPDFKEELRYSAGLGLRYYTAVGPIRVDVATPLNKRPGDSSWALYVGIGQAF